MTPEAYVWLAVAVIAVVVMWTFWIAAILICLGKTNVAVDRIVANLDDCETYLDMILRRLYDDDYDVPHYGIGPRRCRHGEDPSECDECMIESDLAYDAERERRL